MMVANSFDLWQKDAFFSAAEEVQESADVMQSTYRMWIKEKKKRKEGSKTVSFDELSRDLQIALGTAKWQLEEFERAVMLSHGHHSDDSVATRHKQFVAAIKCQISSVEADLMEALSGEGKDPLQWVNLNKEECDDLALFLSGASRTPKSSRLNSTAIGSSTSSTDCVFNSTASGSGCNEWDVNGVTSNKSDEFIIHVEDRDVPRVQDDKISQADITSSGTRRTWSSPNFGGLKVVVADEDEHNDRLLTTDSTPKEKGAKSLFWKQKCGEFSRVKGSSSMFSQLFGQSGGFQRQMQLPLPVQFSCSIQLTLALMLSIFLIVPFLVYSA